MAVIPTIGRTQADAAGFIPQFWAQKALDVLRTKIVLAKLISRDTDYESGFKGKTLNIPYPGTFTAIAKTEGNPATVQQPIGGATIAVTLSQHMTVDFVVEDWAQAQANSTLMDRYMSPAMIALAQNLEQYLFTFYAGLTLPSVGTAGTNMARPIITTAREALNTALVPMTDRHLIISPKDEGALLNDPALQQYFAYAQNKGVTDGEIGDVDGFKIWLSQLVPVVAGAPNTTHNLAIHKDAILLATRPLPDSPPDTGVKSAVAVDDVSGLSIRVQTQYRADYRGMYVAFDLLYGAVNLRPGFGLNVLA